MAAPARGVQAVRPEASDRAAACWARFVLMAHYFGFFVIKKMKYEPPLKVLPG